MFLPVSGKNAKDFFKKVWSASVNSATPEYGVPASAGPTLATLIIGKCSEALGSKVSPAG